MFDVFDGPPREWRERIGCHPSQLEPDARIRFEANLRLAVAHHARTGEHVVPFKPIETATGWVGVPLELWDGGNIEAQFLRHVQVQPLPGVRGLGIITGTWLPGAPRPTEQTQMAPPSPIKTAPAPEKAVIESPTADTATSAPPSTRAEAKEFLQRILRDGPMPAAEVEQRAVAIGITKASLRRAREDLKIKPERHTGPLANHGKAWWQWKLPKWKKAGWVTRK